LAWGVWIGFDWLRTGTGGGCCECGDEPSGSCATDLVKDVDYGFLGCGIVWHGITTRRLQTKERIERCFSCGLWRHAESQTDTNVSKQHTVSIFRA
jgi:hypothetical protein